MMFFTCYSEVDDLVHGIQELLASRFLPHSKITSKKGRGVYLNDTILLIGIYPQLAYSM